MGKYLFYTLSMAVWLAGSGVSMGYDDEIIHPVQAWKKAALTEDVTLNNSSKIYDEATIAFCKAGMLKPSLFQMESHPSINVAWMKNPRADKHDFKVTVRKGTSIFEAIRQIAKRRNEVINDEQNYIIISSSGNTRFRATYQQNVKENPGELARQINSLMVTHMSLVEPEGDAAEDFINAKLKESETLWYEGKPIVNFTFKMDSEAKSKICKINVAGWWTYRDLLNAICALTGLHWKIDGQTLWLEK